MADAAAGSHGTADAAGAAGAQGAARSPGAARARAGALPGFVAWPKELAARYVARGHWRGETLPALLDAWAERSGDAAALVHDERRMSYAELARDARRVAGGLHALGIAPRERVLVQLHNVPEFFVVFYALLRIGAIPVLALPPHRRHEIGELSRIAEAVAYVSPVELRGFDHQQLGREVAAEAPTLRHRIAVGEGVAPDTTAYAQLLEGGEPPAVPQAAGDVAFMLLSGGTTGTPKLIPRTHDDYAYNVRRSAEVCGFTDATRYLGLLPVPHNFALGCPGVLGTLGAGGLAVLADAGPPEAAFALIERHAITATALVPALALRWMDDPRRTERELGSLELLQVGGARLNPEGARRVQPLLGCRLQQVFGMAEGLLNFTRLDDEERVVIETQGRPMSPEDEIRIVDDEDREVPAGEPGQLLTRGPYTIRGYFNAPEHNARAFTADGFYRSGDVVRRDPSGNLVVEGRAKDLINRGGEKISAEELETLILAHPRVFDVAIVAMPDPQLGERTCAYVVTRDGAPLELADVVELLLVRDVAKYKLPERLEQLEALPLTNVGKVSKQALRDDVAAKLAAEAAS
jgi:2,3-dihydroxybenzoate-AMP ligase